MAAGPVFPCSLPQHTCTIVDIEPSIPIVQFQTAPEKTLSVRSSCPVIVWCAYTATHLHLPPKVKISTPRSPIAHGLNSMLPITMHEGCVWPLFFRDEKQVH
ncbi:hypothetical protein KIL84_004190 [Mauremys mutica]|uniref:Uncharacterized protein n=1 Tax=Mauremys mutica TaxID=74926 RepID=A0A9D4B623_9SAUR|nr:hypothetical protein KIL84_004190 [Mauremys mutica]